MKYRDTKTGRFVSATTWRRSRSHGGTRYRRVNRTGPRIKKTAGPPRKQPAMAPAAPPHKGISLGFEAVVGAIPAEFLEAADDFFESGYKAEEEEEYP